MGNDELVAMQWTKQRMNYLVRDGPEYFLVETTGVANYAEKDVEIIQTNEICEREQRKFVSTDKR